MPRTFFLIDKPGQIAILDEEGNELHYEYILVDEEKCPVCEELLPENESAPCPICGIDENSDNAEIVAAWLEFHKESEDNDESEDDYDEEDTHEG